MHKLVGKTSFASSMLGKEAQVSDYTCVPYMNSIFTVFFVDLLKSWRNSQTTDPKNYLHRSFHDSNRVFYDHTTPKQTLDLIPSDTKIKIAKQELRCISTCA